MKSTDIDRRNRELKRSIKKQEALDRKKNKRGSQTIGEYINRLSGLFFHDNNRIYNLDNSDILELIEEVRLNLEERQWEVVLRKAIKKTGVSEREQAFEKLKSYLHI
ncbi:MAG: hypothetical protein JW881_19500 [Spirochaetales bacterium]|nr:hypothetical protein [Spirochaetales bacterium]